VEYFTTSGQTSGSNYRILKNAEQEIKYKEVALPEGGNRPPTGLVRLTAEDQSRKLSNTGKGLSVALIRS